MKFPWFKRRDKRPTYAVYANVAKGMNVGGTTPVVLDYGVKDRDLVLKQWKPEGKVLRIEFDEDLNVISARTEKK